jgi:hypothetical protein
VTQGAHIKAPQGADDGRHVLLSESIQLPTLAPLTAHKYLNPAKEQRNKVIGTDQKTGLNRDKPRYSGIRIKIISSMRFLRKKHRFLYAGKIFPMGNGRHSPAHPFLNRPKTRVNTLKYAYARMSSDIGKFFPRAETTQSAVFINLADRGSRSGI